MNKAMRYSGIEWLGKIPRDWEVLKAKRIFKLKNEKNSELKPLLSVSKGRGLLLREDMANRPTHAQKNIETFKLVDEGDFVIHLRSFQSGFELSSIEGAVSPAYTVFNARKNDEVCDKYYKYLFYSKPFIDKIASTTLSLRDGKPISYDEFSITLLPVPNYVEQQKISAFLDEKISRIDNIIEDTKKSIENLKAYKQSLITETVTKGLDSNVDMKDSGIVWIGEIPKYWNIAPISRLFIIKAGGDAKPEFYSEAPDKEHLYPVYTNTNIENKVYAYTSNPLFPAESITVTGRGAIGKAFYRNTPFDAIIRLIVLMAKFNFDTRYFAYFISNVIQFNTGSSAISQLSTLQIAPYKLAVPPVDEQHKIADFLDKKTTNIDSLIDQKDILITELESYKKSIIYEYVTGKKEVK